MIPRNWKRYGSLATLALLATIGCQSAGMSQTASRADGSRGQAEQRFDLLVYGFGLDQGEHEVFLRNNLDFGHSGEFTIRVPGCSLRTCSERPGSRVTTTAKCSPGVVAINGP